MNFINNHKFLPGYCFETFFGSVHTVGLIRTSLLYSLGFHLSFVYEKF